MPRYAAIIQLSALLILLPSAGWSADAGALDKESAACMKCHTTAAQPAPGEPPGSSGPMTHAGGFGHPVGMDYAALAARNQGLTPPSELNPAIRLVDNRLSCVTCHVPYSEYDHKALSKKRKELPSDKDPMLSMPNTSSGLCTACHRK